MSLPSWSTFGVDLSNRPLSYPRHSRALNQDHPGGGGILRVRGWAPPRFDPHLTTASFTQSTLSFVYSTLVRHQVDAEIPPGTFIVEPDLAERWEEPNDTTYVFYLRKGVRWHNKPPVSGRELVAEDVKFTYDRFLTEKRNMARSPIGWCANRTWRRSRRVTPAGLPGFPDLEHERDHDAHR
jgi:ABC-type transport system substrate-binding protein